MTDPRLHAGMRSIAERHSRHVYAIVLDELRVAFRFRRRPRDIHVPSAPFCPPGLYYVIQLSKMSYEAIYLE